MAERDDLQGGGSERPPGPAVDCSTAGAGAQDCVAQTTGKKVSAAEIAGDWGTSRAYAAQRIKAGCPTDSLEAAREWRVKNSKYGVGYRSKMKAQPAASASASPAVRPPAAKGELPDRPKLNVELGDEEDERLPETPDVATLRRSLQAAVEMEWLAFGQAIANPSEARIRAYNQARDGRFTAEKAYREELERRRVLVPLVEAMSLSRKGYDVLKPALLAMGARIGGNCNPANPASAAAEIDREVAAILRQAEGAYAAGSESSPTNVPAPMAAAPSGETEEGLT